MPCRDYFKEVVHVSVSNPDLRRLRAQDAFLHTHNSQSAAGVGFLGFVPYTPPHLTPPHPNSLPAALCLAAAPPPKAAKPPPPRISLPFKFLIVRKKQPRRIML